MGLGFDEKPLSKKTRHYILRRNTERPHGIIRWQEKKVVSRRFSVVSKKTAKRVPLCSACIIVRKDEPRGNQKRGNGRRRSRSQRFKSRRIRTTWR